MLTKRRVNKAVDEIIDAVLDNTVYDVEVSGPQDYDVQMYVEEHDKANVSKLLYDILTDKRPRKWWQLLSVSVRRMK